MHHLVRGEFRVETFAGGFDAGDRELAGVE